MALGDELPEPDDDKTIPKYKQIDKRCGAYIHDWGVLLAEEAETHLANQRAGAKKKHDLEDADEDLKPRKKVKASGGGGAGAELKEMGKEELKSLVSKNGLAKFTVAQLKEFCTIKGLGVGGKKGDLVERVEAWVEE